MHFGKDNQTEHKQSFLMGVLSFILWVMLVLTTLEVILSDTWTCLSFSQGVIAALLLIVFRFNKGVILIGIAITFIYLTIFSSPFIGLDVTAGLLTMFAFFMIINYSLEVPIISLINKIEFIILGVGYYIITRDRAFQSFDLYDYFNLIVVLIIIGLVIYTVRHYEQQLKRYQDKIEASNHFLQEITDINPQLIFTKNKDRQFNFVNRAMTKARNLTKQDFYGKTDIEIGTAKEQAADYEVDDKRVLEHGATISRPIELINNEGKHKWFETIKKPILDKNKKITGLLAVTTDITKQKEKEQELIAAKKKAEESDRLKSAFLANMSHEIRTPMNSIIGFSELLLDTSFTLEEQQEYFNIINQNCQQLLHIVSDILDISKLETGQTRIIDTTFCINNDLLDSLEKNFSAEANAKGLTFHWEHSNKDEFYIKSDEMKVRQILTNLISNAIKYTDEGSVRFGYELPRDYLIRFYVQDTGIGIAPENIDDVFNRFQRTENSIKLGYKGTGLGLAISQGFAELLGGKIFLASEKGKGTTFYFDLPYKKRTTSAKGRLL